MIYAEIPVPERIAFGAQRAPGWRTGVVVTASGHESTDSQWSDARHDFDVSFAVRTVRDYEALQDHFHSVRGRWLAFPFKDYVDFTVTTARGILLDETTDGRQLAKRYGYAGYEWNRMIQKPVVDTVAIWRTRGVTATDISADSVVDYTTGLVTIDDGALEEGDILSWAGQFWVPCRYDVDRLPTLIVNKRSHDDQLLVQCDSIPIIEVRLDLEVSS